VHHAPLANDPEDHVRVLLVCDNPRISAKVTSALIGDPELSLVEVRTPERAVALLDEGNTFDLVLGDNDTAPSGGFFLAREIKARGQMGQDMPPVALFLAREQDRFLSNWSQADAYIIKPLDPFDLREVVTRLAAGEPLPALPGVGGEPTPSLLDIPGEDSEGELNPSAGGLPAGTG
jgi:CheY-like chemotaxis protein